MNSSLVPAVMPARVGAISYFGISLAASAAFLA
jgi:hypothetical protein